MAKTPERRFGPEQDQARLGRRFVETYRAWRNTGEMLDTGNQIRPIETELVDQDFSPAFVSSRKDAYSKLSGLRGVLFGDAPVYEFMRGHIDATLVYMDALDGRNFQPKFPDYVRLTSGFEPHPLPLEALDSQKKVSDRAAINAGIDPSPEGLKRHFDTGISKEEIREEFTESKNRLVPIIARALDLEYLLPLKYDEQFVELPDAFWKFHSANERAGSSFEINVHPNIRWAKGSPEELATHEVGGHLLQTSSWRKNIGEGKLNPAFGLLSAPNPIQWQSEGLASTLPLILPEVYEAMTPIGKFTMESSHLSKLAWHNGHLMINEGHDVNEVKEFIRKYIPYETDARLERQITMRRDNPFVRTYMLNYSDGANYFVNASQELGPQKTVDLLKALYHQPMTPDQVKAHVAILKAA